MKLTEKYFKEIVPEFEKLEIVRIPNSQCPSFYSVNAMSGKQALGGGFDKNLEQAIAKCLSESYERKIHSKLKQVRPLTLGLDIDPTSTGFALGFDKTKTKVRSIFEALERWTWSKWIDDGLYIDEEIFESPQNISSLTSSFLAIRHFKKNFDLKFFPGKRVTVSILLAINENGIFPGTRTYFSENSSDVFHAIVEAWRHLQISQDEHILGNNREDIFAKRVAYFSYNKTIALEHISRAKNKIWPIPELKFSSELTGLVEPFVGFRSLFNNYISWEKGSVERFVY